MDAGWGRVVQGGIFSHRIAECEAWPLHIKLLVFPYEDQQETFVDQGGGVQGG